MALAEYGGRRVACGHTTRDVHVLCIGERRIGGEQRIANIDTFRALMGKVCCKVDAGYRAIAVGDLLTTSPTSGHAMKVSDPVKAFGAVIGKALGILAEGWRVVPILVALQ